jgi:NADPH-dependent 7-cyano-7-deazaguanine reductase QueF
MMFLCTLSLQRLEKVLKVWHKFENLRHKAVSYEAPTQTPDSHNINADYIVNKWPSVRLNKLKYYFGPKYILKETWN